MKTLVSKFLLSVISALVLSASAFGLTVTILPGSNLETRVNDAELPSDFEWHFFAPDGWAGSTSAQNSSLSASADWIYSSNANLTVFGGSSLSLVQSGPTTGGESNRFDLIFSIDEMARYSISGRAEGAVQGAGSALFALLAHNSGDDIFRQSDYWDISGGPVDAEIGQGDFSGNREGILNPGHYHFVFSHHHHFSNFADASAEFTFELRPVPDQGAGVGAALVFLAMFFVRRRGA